MKPFIRTFVVVKIFVCFKTKEVIYTQRLLDIENWYFHFSFVLFLEFFY